MKPYKQKVTSKKQLVAVLEGNHCETLQECLDTYGEAKVIELVNSQSLTNVMNVARGSASGTTSKKRLRELAMEEIIGEVGQGQHKDVIANNGIPALVEKRMDEIEARLKAQAPVAVADDAADDNDNENSEE